MFASHIILLMKGADEVVIKDLDMEKAGEIEETQKLIKKLSSFGMRIFMLAYKVIEAKYWNKWKAEYEELKIE